MRRKSIRDGKKTQKPKRKEKRLEDEVENFKHGVTEIFGTVISQII